MLAGTHRVDRRGQGAIGHVDQLLCRTVDRADPHRERSVAVPTGDDGTTVDRQDVALFEHSLVGDAVHQFLVDGGADGGRISVVAEEVRGGAAAGEHIPSDSIELQRGHAGSSGRTDGLMHLGDDAARSAHVPQILR
jgi:hypothetical protein